jgi:hypothetical protein
MWLCLLQKNHHSGHDAHPAITLCKPYKLIFSKNSKTQRREKKCGQTSFRSPRAIADFTRGLLFFHAHLPWCILVEKDVKSTLP